MKRVRLACYLSLIFFVASYAGFSILAFIKCPPQLYTLETPSAVPECIGKTSEIVFVTLSLIGIPYFLLTTFVLARGLKFKEFGLIAFTLGSLWPLSTFVLNWPLEYIGLVPAEIRSALMRTILQHELMRLVIFSIPVICINLSVCLLFSLIWNFRWAIPAAMAVTYSYVVNFSDDHAWRNYGTYKMLKTAEAASEH